MFGFIRRLKKNKNYGNSFLDTKQGGEYENVEEQDKVVSLNGFQSMKDPK